MEAIPPAAAIRREDLGRQKMGGEDRVGAELPHEAAETRKLQPVEEANGLRREARPLAAVARR